MTEINNILRKLPNFIRNLNAIDLQYDLINWFYDVESEYRANNPNINRITAIPT